MNEAQELSDHELVERVLNGEVGLYELIMRRYNQRLFRIARSVLKDDGEAEDIVQDVWIQVYTQLDSFPWTRTHGIGVQKTSDWILGVEI